MKNQLKLSEKDKRLLFLLFSLIVIAISYFFVYTKNISKAEEINTGNVTLQARVDELTTMQADADTKKAETEKFRSQIKEMEDKFPAALNTEDTILMLDGLENNADMQISSASFTMNELFYPSGVDQAATTAAATATTTPATQTTTDGTAQAGTDATAATTDTATDETQPASSNLMGYKSTITIAYQTTYAGLKKAIDYINQNSNRMSIGDLNATFDSSTGNLMGSMSISMYSLLGTDKVYEEPYVDGMNTGLNNIFGTIEH